MASKGEDQPLNRFSWKQLSFSWYVTISLFIVGGIFNEWRKDQDWKAQAAASNALALQSVISLKADTEATKAEVKELSKSVAATEQIAKAAQQTAREAVEQTRLLENKMLK